MAGQLTAKLIKACTLGLAIGAASQGLAQPVAEQTLDDSTVTYPARFFDAYSPVSVNDMIDRIEEAAVIIVVVASDQAKAKS